MTIDVFSIRKNAPISEAIEVMLRNQISGLPVAEEDMTLLGIITEKDVLTLYRNPAEANDLTVESLMTTPAVFFDEDETINNICDCLIEHDFRRVPVTSKGKVVGLISRPDIVQHILRLAQQQSQ